jgi:hypothetical protein
MRALPAAQKIRNHSARRTVIFLMRRSVLYILRKERLKLFLFACALLAAGCANDSDNAQDQRIGTEAAVDIEEASSEASSVRRQRRRVSR